MNLKKILEGYCKFTDRLVTVSWNIAAVLLGLLTAALAVQIFRRTVLNSPIFGIEEGVTAAIVWFAALGECGGDEGERTCTGGIFPPVCPSAS